MNRRLLLVAIVCCWHPQIAWSDSYGPFCNFRQADPTGRYYLVVKKLPGNPPDPGRGTSVSFELAENKRPADRVVDASDEDDPESDGFVPNPDVSVRKGDEVLGRGTLVRCPRYIVISSTGLGFAGMDVGGYNYGAKRSGDAVVIVGPDGAVRHRKNLIDVFNEQDLTTFMHTAGGIWWTSGGWICEKRKALIVVGGSEKSRLFRIVKLDDGTVSAGASEEVVSALAELERSNLDFVLDLTAELKLSAAKPHLPKIFENASLSLETRLRAANALAVLGDRRGARLFIAAALEKTPAQDYALRNLPLMLGDDAAKVLCDAVRKHGRRVAGEAWDAMHDVRASAAVPALLELIREENNPVGVDFAAECLGNKGPDAKAAVPELMRLIEKEPKTPNPLWTMHLAANALGRIGPDAKAAAPLLMRIVEQHPQRMKAAKAVPFEPTPFRLFDPVRDEEQFQEAVKKAIGQIER